MKRNLAIWLKNGAMEPFLSKYGSFDSKNATKAQFWSQMTPKCSRMARWHHFGANMVYLAPRWCLGRINVPNGTKMPPRHHFGYKTSHFAPLCHHGSFGSKMVPWWHFGAKWPKMAPMESFWSQTSNIGSNMVPWWHFGVK